MLGWREEWQAISARLVGIVEAVNFACMTNPRPDGDPHNLFEDFVARPADSVMSAIEAFAKGNRALLPAAGVALLDELSRTFPNRGDTGPGAVRRKTVCLMAFRATFEHAIANGDAMRRRLAERAFIHLQQSIAADDGLRARWGTAFAKTHGQAEPACETLGAVHLLSHGIWSFKAYGPGGTGGRTDLVLAGPLGAESLATMAEAADALVLTEWKVARTPAEVDERIGEAIAQARIYGRGILASVELMSTRYAVIVTEKQIAARPPRLEGDVEYRVVNIAVNPVPPSVAAKT